MDVPAADAFTDVPARYVVGIDLGTTNSAVASVDTAAADWRVESFPVVQLVAPGEAAARDVLPSFVYLPPPGEWSEGETRLPWDGPSDAPGDKTQPGVVGVLARDHGVAVAGRQIASAKSWLCHAGVDRTAAILPWQADPGVPRLSPVEVSGRYLAHLRAAWDAGRPDAPLADQDVIVTLPASFDEVARELTIEAARRAGLPRITLIEEPQAAFYAWIDRHRDSWDDLVRPGQKILVCDIGGGTTDFTLIRVRGAGGDDAGRGRSRVEGGAAGPSSARVTLHRVAVGDHLILGGDNLDLAVARELERRLAAKSTGPAGPSGGARRRWETLLRQARSVKETLLASDAPESVTIGVPRSGGARLVGATERLTVGRDELRTLLLEGFFPRCGLTDRPADRGSGFTEFGLPYAPDSGVTRYLAAFLTDHRTTGDDEAAPGGRPRSGGDQSGSDAGHDPARPDLVLFNGGVLESAAVRDRLLDALAAWFPGPDTDGSPWRPVVLDGERRDQAVARGAAYFGMTRRGAGVKIAANLARTYYLAVEGAGRQAVCVVPGRAEAGERFVLPRRLALTVRRPIELRLLVSSTRLTDPPGALVAIDDEAMRPLPPLRTVVRPRGTAATRRGDGADGGPGPADTIPVRLVAELTEIGTLTLALEEVDGPHRWTLDFDVRSATRTDRPAEGAASAAEEAVDEATWSELAATLAGCFVEGTVPPGEVWARLGQTLDRPRDRWPVAVLRRTWRWLIEHPEARRRSPALESRWLNMVGYTLRPGYGVPLDDWRVAEVWRTTQGRIVHPRGGARAEMLVLWRRIAGGLTAGQQAAIADPLVAVLTAFARRTATGRGAGPVITPAESVEMWRLVGSLERLPTSTKEALIGTLLSLWDRPKLAAATPAMIWALGRLGERVPVYGSLDRVVRVETAETALTHLMQARRAWNPADLVAVMQLARRTGDPTRDVGVSVRRQALDFLAEQGAAGHLIALVEEVGELQGEELTAVVGESLPLGLALGPEPE